MDIDVAIYGIADPRIGSRGRNVTKVIGAAGTNADAVTRHGPAIDIAIVNVEQCIEVRGWSEQQLRTDGLIIVRAGFLVTVVQVPRPAIALFLHVSDTTREKAIDERTAKGRVQLYPARTTPAHTRADGAKTAPALREVFNELERIKSEAPTDEEADRARNLAALSMPSAFDNGGGTANFWADIVARKTDPARVQRFMAARAGVTL